MKDIYFFQVNFEIGFGAFKTYWLPYAVTKLWSYCKTDIEIASYWNAAAFEFERRDVDDAVKRIDSPVIAAFSCYIWNWNYNLSLAKRIKEKWPDCIIVLGGPQVPEQEDSLSELYANHNYIDYTFHGESELTFATFLKNIKNGVTEMPNGITSASQINSTRGARVNDLSILPSPFLDGTLDQILDDNQTKNFSVTLETTRGCPYACTFCDWGSLTYNKIKKVPTDIVEQEISWIANNKIKFVDVSDANYGIFKDRDFNLLREMIKMKTLTGFPESYSFNWQKNSTSETLSMVDFLTKNNSARGFTLSVQSMSDDVLTHIKRNNLEISNFKSLLAQCNANNIQTYTELILGLPNETKASWKEGMNALLEAGQHNNIEVWFCQLLENAELNSPTSKKTYDIKSAKIVNYISGESSTDLLEGISVIKSTSTLSFEDLVDSYMYSWMITNFHSFGWTQIISRWLRSNDNISFDEFYNNFHEFVKQDEMLKTYYTEVRDNIINAFSTGYIKGRGMHYYISEYQKKFHYNRSNIFEKISIFLNSSNYNIPEDVMAFTKEYVTSEDDSFSKVIEIKTPVWEMINNLERDDSAKYTFKMVDVYKDTAEYYDSFYFRRRKGWGKHLVTINKDTDKHDN